MKLITISVLLLTLTGCTATIIDRDFEAEEAEFIKKNGEAAKDPFFAPSTPDNVLAAKDDGVIITVFKKAQSTQEHLKLQDWQAVLRNDNKYPVCVITFWKLMDFALVTDYADFTLVPALTTVTNYAELKQQIWDISGTRFSLPPSGYIEKMIVRSPKPGVKRGYECVFESDVVEM